MQIGHLLHGSCCRRITGCRQLDIPAEKMLHIILNSQTVLLQIFKPQLFKTRLCIPEAAVPRIT